MSVAMNGFAPLRENAAALDAAAMNTLRQLGVSHTAFGTVEFKWKESFGISGDESELILSLPEGWDLMRLYEPNMFKGRERLEKALATMYDTFIKRERDEAAKARAEADAKLPDPNPRSQRLPSIITTDLEGADLANALREQKERRLASKKAYRNNNLQKLAVDHKKYYNDNKAAVDARAYRTKIEKERLAANADPTFVPTKRLPKAAIKHGVAVEQAPAITLQPEEVRVDVSHPVDAEHEAEARAADEEKLRVEFEAKARVGGGRGKKRAIPKNVKLAAWNKWLGESNGIAKCWCCNVTSIDKGGGWHCGHVVAEAHGGDASVTNLRPVCPGCNSGMGTQNMIEFMLRHYPARHAEVV